MDTPAIEVLHRGDRPPQLQPGRRTPADHRTIALPSDRRFRCAPECRVHRIGDETVATDAGDHLVEPAQGPARTGRRPLHHRRRQGRTTGRVEIITTASPGVEPPTTIVRSFTARIPTSPSPSPPVCARRYILQSVRSGASEIGLLGAAYCPADLEVLPLERDPPGTRPGVNAPGSNLTGRGRVTDLSAYTRSVAQRGSHGGS